MLRLCRCCCITVATKPGRRDGGGKVDWHTFACVLDDGGAVCAVSIAPCARARTCGVVLIMDSACRRRAVHHFCAHTQLVGWVGRAGIVLVVPSGLGILGTGGEMLIVHYPTAYRGVG